MSEWLCLLELAISSYKIKACRDFSNAVCSSIKQRLYEDEINLVIKIMCKIIASLVHASIGPPIDRLIDIFICSKFNLQS